MSIVFFTDEVIASKCGNSTSYFDIVNKTILANIVNGTKNMEYDIPAMTRDEVARAIANAYIKNKELVLSSLKRCICSTIRSNGDTYTDKDIVTLFNSCKDTDLAVLNCICRNYPCFTYIKEIEDVLLPDTNISDSETLYPWHQEKIL